MFKRPPLLRPALFALTSALLALAVACTPARRGGGNDDDENNSANNTTGNNSTTSNNNTSNNNTSGNNNTANNSTNTNNNTANNNTANNNTNANNTNANNTPTNNNAAPVTLSVNPTGIAFDGTRVGTTDTQQLRVENTGGRQVVLDAASDQAVFTVTPTSATLAPGASTMLSVRFTPSASGAWAGTLTLRERGGETLTDLRLSGFAVEASPSISASPTLLSFGQQPVGASSTRAVTVRNTGSGTLNVNAQLTGSGFALRSASSFSVAAGGQANVEVAFTPSAQRFYDATLELFSDDPARPTLTVSLEGQGTAPAGGCSEDVLFAGQLQPPNVAWSPNSGSATSTPWGSSYNANIQSALALVPASSVEGENTAAIFQRISGATVIATSFNTEAQRVANLSFWVADGRGAIQVYLSADALDQLAPFNIQVGQVLTFDAIEVTNYGGKPEITAISPGSWSLLNTNVPVYVADRTNSPITAGDVSHLVRTAGTIIGGGAICGGVSKCWELETEGGTVTLRSRSDLLSVGSCITWQGPPTSFNGTLQLDVVNFDWLWVQ